MLPVGVMRWGYLFADDSASLSDALDYTSEYNTDVNQKHPDVDASVPLGWIQYLVLMIRMVLMRYVLCVTIYMR